MKTIFELRGCFTCGAKKGRWIGFYSDKGYQFAICSDCINNFNKNFEDGWQVLGVKIEEPEKK